MAVENPFCKGPSTLDWSCNVKKSYKVCTLPGDGIGPEVIAEGKKVLAAVGARAGVEFICEDALIGGAAIDACADPLPEATLAAGTGVRRRFAGERGRAKWDSTDPDAPVPSKVFFAFAKLWGFTPIFVRWKIYDALAGASTLKPEVIKGVDMVLVRELTAASTW